MDISNQKNREVRLILDSIRSVHNVGSLFRTAEGAGVSRMYLCGTTPTPVDRFGRKRADLAKVALGAEDMVSWEHPVDMCALISSLRSQGFRVIALEQAPHSVDYRMADMMGKVAIIVGNEVEGVSKEILGLCDSIVEIPMAGEKESLNVAVATGILLFRIIG